MNRLGLEERICFVKQVLGEPMILPQNALCCSQRSGGRPYFLAPPRTMRSGSAEPAWSRNGLRNTEDTLSLTFAPRFPVPIYLERCWPSSPKTTVRFGRGRFMQRHVLLGCTIYDVFLEF
jgi:hypothetical protein